MAGQQIDHLAMAEEAARLNSLAVEHSDEGRRVEALAAAEEAGRLYRTLAEDFPTMFGTEADRADALAAAIREGRPLPSTAVRSAARPRVPVAEPAAVGIPAADIPVPRTPPGPDEPVAVTDPGPEPSDPPAGTPRRRRRARRRTGVSAMLVSAAVVVLVLGAIGAAGWALSRPSNPAAAPPPPPPAAAPAKPWTATARADVAPTGITLRSAPSTVGAPVGRLPTGVEVQIQCAQVGRMTSTDGGERSSGWLRTTAGTYLAAVNTEVSGPSPMKNCTPGRPPVPLPHHR